MTRWLAAIAGAKPAVVLVAGRTVGVAAAFAIPIVLARLFDQSDFGTYKQLFLIYATLFGLAQLGMAESLYYFLPRHPAVAGRQVANALATLGLLGAACLAALVVFREPIARGLGNPPLADHLPPLGVFLALMLPAAAIEIVLISRKRHAAAAWTYAVSDLARTALLILPAVFLWGIGGVMIGAAVFAALRLGAGLIALWRVFGSGLRVDAGQWLRQLAYALPFALAVGIEVLHVNWHQWAVASRFDAAAFAVYAVGCLQIPLVDLIVSSTVNVMMVDMTEEVHTRGGAAAPALWHETIGRLAFVMFPLAAFLLLMAYPIITLLYTTAYGASAPIFMLWSLTMLASVLVVDGVLRVFAETRFLLVMNALQLAIVAALAAPLLTMFGLRGAVLATLTATAIVKTMAVVRIVRLMRLPAARALPWARLAAAALCAALAALPVLWLRHLLTLPPAAVIVSGAAIYGLVYLVLYTLVSDSVGRRRWPVATVN